MYKSWGRLLGRSFFLSSHETKVIEVFCASYSGSLSPVRAVSLTAVCQNFSDSPAKLGLEQIEMNSFQALILMSYTQFPTYARRACLHFPLSIHEASYIKCFPRSLKNHSVMIQSSIIFKELLALLGNFLEI